MLYIYPQFHLQGWERQGSAPHGTPTSSLPSRPSGRRSRLTPHQAYWRRALPALIASAPVGDLRRADRGPEVAEVEAQRAVQHPHQRATIARAARQLGAGLPLDWTTCSAQVAQRSRRRAGERTAGPWRPGQGGRAATVAGSLNNSQRPGPRRRAPPRQNLRLRPPCSRASTQTSRLSLPSRSRPRSLVR